LLAKVQAVFFLFQFKITLLVTIKLFFKKVILQMAVMNTLVQVIIVLFAI